jgi:MSHA pilin protein MshC
MVEMIVVMILAGILGAIGVARFFDRNSFDADAFTGQARAMLRYAQKVAVAQNRAVLVRLDGDSIALCFDRGCSAANQVLAPSGANSGSSATQAYCGSSVWYCEGRPASVTSSLSWSGTAAAPGPGSFYFDAQGKPYAAADPDGSVKSRFARLTMVIGGDGEARAVTVVPETGYVY